MKTLIVLGYRDKEQIAYHIPGDTLIVELPEYIKSFVDYGYHLNRVAIDWVEDEDINIIAQSTGCIAVMMWLWRKPRVNIHSIQFISPLVYLRGQWWKKPATYVLSWLGVKEVEGVALKWLKQLFTWQSRNVEDVSNIINCPIQYYLSLDDQVVDIPRTMGILAKNLDSVKYHDLPHNMLKVAGDL